MGNLVLVAGPSGSGKSTFLHQLSENKLPPEILALLPAGARTWRQMNALTAAKRKIGSDEKLILHFNLVAKVGPFRINRKFVDYLKIHNSITAVTLVLERSRLVKQFIKGKTGLPIPIAVALLRASQYQIVAPLTRPFGWLMSSPMLTRRRSKKWLFTLDEYKRERLDVIYKQWGATLEELAESGCNLKRIHITPDEQSNVVSWRLALHP